MKKENWGTHEFHYEENDLNSIYKNRRNSKCIICGISWEQLSADYWCETNNNFIIFNKKGSSVIKIINCNEFIIKNIIE